MAFFKKWLSSFAKPKEVAEETIQEEVSVVEENVSQVEEVPETEVQLETVNEEIVQKQEPTKEEMEAQIKRVREMMSEHAYEFSKKFPIWMKCNLLMNQIHAGELLEQGKTIEEINLMVNWDKVNSFLQDSYVDYDYNMFDEIKTIEDLERLRGDAITASVMDDWPSYRQKCKQCGHDFSMSRKEINWFLNRELNVPHRCNYCRKGIKRPEPVKVIIPEPKPVVPEKTSMQIAMEKAGLKLS